ncbi:MAG: hypothetical protein HZC48_12050 [Nitrospirae bacterium]|nr:hypothetical protein [Nitrospirota bacterium]
MTWKTEKLPLDARMLSDAIIELKSRVVMSQYIPKGIIWSKSRWIGLLQSAYLYF